MVSFHVFAKPHSCRSFDFSSRRTTISRPPSPLQTFNVELSTFDLLHSSPLFSLCYTLFSATGVPQPFVYQSLPHSFHRDGVCTPPSCLRRSEAQTCGRFNVLPSYPLCFQILAHSFAHRYLICFHGIPHSLSKTPGVGGGCDGLGA